MYDDKTTSVHTRNKDSFHLLGIRVFDRAVQTAVCICIWVCLNTCRIDRFIQRFSSLVQILVCTKCGTNPMPCSVWLAPDKQTLVCFQSRNTNQTLIKFLDVSILYPSRLAETVTTRRCMETDLEFLSEMALR